MKVPRIANFWMRLLVRLLDSTLMVSPVLAISLLFIVKTNQGYDFASAWMFYFWIFLAIVWIWSLGIFVPFFLGGQTLAMLILKVKIVPIDVSKLTLRKLILREMPFSVAWSGLLILGAAILNHTLIGKIASTKATPNFDSFEKIRIGVISTFSGFVVILQLFCCFGLIARADKQGLHDRISLTKTIFKNRFVTKVESVKISSKIAPQYVNDEIIRWIEDV